MSRKNWNFHSGRVVPTGTKMRHWQPYFYGPRRLFLNLKIWGRKRLSQSARAPKYLVVGEPSWCISVEPHQIYAFRWGARPLWATSFDCHTSLRLTSCKFGRILQSSHPRHARAGNDARHHIYIYIHSIWRCICRGSISDLSWTHWK